MAFDNSEQIDSEKKPLFINSGNIETANDGTLCYVNVNRLNAKYRILYMLLCCYNKSAQSVFKKENNDDARNEFELYVRTAKYFKDLATGYYTAPHYGYATSEEINKTLTACFKENHILATLEAIFFGEYNDKAAEIDDKYKCKNIVLQEQEYDNIADERDVRKKYLVIQALEDIRQQISSLYENDNLVKKVLTAIETDNVEEKENLTKTMVGIITEESVKEEQKIGKTKMSVVKSSYIFNKDRTEVADRVNHLKRVSIAGIDFDRSDVKTQQIYRNNNTGDLGELGGISNTINYVLKNSKRYYINKDTGYVYETPDKNIELLTYSDDVRIYNGEKWFDKKDNAVIAQGISYSGRKKSKIGSFLFSFFDPDKGSYVYSNPFKGSIILAKPEKEFDNRMINSNLDTSILALRMKNGSIYDDEKNFFKEKEIFLDPDCDPFVIDKINDEVESLERTRAFGYGNVLSESIITDVLGNLHDTSSIIRETAKAMSPKDINEAVFGNVCANLRAYYKFIDETTIEEQKRELMYNLSKWYLHSIPKDLTVCTYEDGIEQSRSNLTSITKASIFNDYGFCVTNTGLSTNPSSNFLNKMVLEELNKNECLTVFNEDFEYKRYVSDLASSGYNKKDEVEKYEEFLKNHKETVNDVKRKKTDLKKIAEIQKKAEEENNEFAVDAVKSAVAKISNIKETSFFDIIKKFFYKFFLGEDYETDSERTLNRSIYTIKHLSKSILFDKKDVQKIRKVIAGGCTKLNVSTPEITFKVNANLNDARKGNKKNI